MKHKRRFKTPSWREIRIGLLQAPKLRLVSILGKIFLSRATPKSVKKMIVAVAVSGVRRVSRKTRKTSSRIRRKSRSIKNSAKTKFISIKMKNGKSRKQKVRVLSSGKLRFIKN